jgi:hypothetical protein
LSSNKKQKQINNKTNNSTTMKKAIVLFAGLFLITLAAQNLNAQTNASATAATSAYIVTPIAIAKTIDLNFGNIVPTSAAGTVVVATDGTRSFTGGAYAFANSTGNPTAASFTVTGESGATYSVTVNNPSFNVTNGSNNMLIDDITTSPSPTGVLTGGTQTLTVGATLNVTANQAPGLYTNANALQITVAYN